MIGAGRGKVPPGKETKGTVATKSVRPEQLVKYMKTLERDGFLEFTRAEFEREDLASYETHPGHLTWLNAMLEEYPEASPDHELHARPFSRSIY